MPISAAAAVILTAVSFATVLTITATTGVFASADAAAIAAIAASPHGTRWSSA